METESFFEVKEGSLVLLIFFYLCLSFSVCISALGKRVRNYISSGLDTELMDPDNSANMDRKRACFVANSRLPYDRVTKPPCGIWIDSLANFPSVLFSSIYQHFVERSVRVALGILSDSDTVDRESTEL